MSGSGGKRAAIVVIGETDCIENAEHSICGTLLQRLTMRTDCAVIAEFHTIGAALRAGLGETLRADIVLVLQLWSDQYPRSDVDSLIGRMLFSRILCSYGPWCESDGRTRDYWPVALRVSLRLTESVLSLELQRFQHGRPPLLPIVAAEEIFADRCQADEASQPTISRPALPEHPGTVVLVVGCDRVLREMWTTVCFSLGMTGSHYGLLTNQTVRTVSAQTPTPDLVIHDLDPGLEFVGDSLQQVRRRFPNARLFGIATIPETMSDQEIADAGIHSVIPKLDVIHGLHRHLQLR